MFIVMVSPRSTGKTTNTAWLAHALHARGYKVKGFDADESQQLWRWKNGAPEPGETGSATADDCYPFEVEALASTRFHELAPALLPEGHIGVVDCGHLENHTGVGQSVLRRADLVLIAFPPNTSEMERMDELPMDFFLDKAFHKRGDGLRPPTLVLMCRAQPNTVAPKQYRELLTDAGWEVLQTVIPAVQQYATTGEGVPIHAPGSHFDALVTELEQRGLISK